jgi:hypothetical protein
MATTLDVSVNSAVIFLDSRLSQALTGTVSAINDHFHVSINLTNGAKLTNVPHLTLGRPVGWYAQVPSETVSHVAAPTAYRTKQG